MKKIFYTLIILGIISSCGEKDKKENTGQKEESTTNTKETDSVKSETEYLGAEAFTPFENIEQIQYTIFLPGTYYRHHHDSCEVRAQHYFYSPNDPNDYIEVTGMFRSDESMGIEEYFANSYTVEDEESGKIIESKKLYKTDSAFCATGYWSNFPDRKFLEITWFGKEDVVKLYVNDYLADHQPFWKSKAEFLIKKGVKFE